MEYTIILSSIMKNQKEVLSFYELIIWITKWQAN